MSLVKNVFGKKNVSKENVLINLFHDMEDEPDFPFKLALSSCEKLHESAQNKNELIEFLLEDVVFTSIYATFYEEIMATIMTNPEYTNKLVESFSNDSKKREQIIAEHTQLHMNYVLNLGKCQGCAACENHQDLEELVDHWKNQNQDFFLNLYIGMQTIQYTMEYILYDVLPLEEEFVSALTRENILDLRQYVFKFAEDKLASL